MGILSKRYSDAMLMQSGIGVHYGGVVLPFVEMIIRLEVVALMGGCGRKEGREVAAAPSAVVALPTVEVRRWWWGVCVSASLRRRFGRDPTAVECSDQERRWVP
ncbi:hypothetical protein GH714_027642 [Hevea brasiliensis]|uniref:Uncharacterized protein n=1 Tax=Hevea brasiliensis TaxID=3981 RepID=A0A6A6MHY4_HEVBR|nr:hypothetical protein GH714_027642 [Hevea brasiliensis]